MFLSKLYRQMYASTGISTDSARRKRSKQWARWSAKQCRRLFQAQPLPELPFPAWVPAVESRRTVLDDKSHGDMSPFLVIPTN